MEMCSGKTSLGISRRLLVTSVRASVEGSQLQMSFGEVHFETHRKSRGGIGV